MKNMVMSDETSQRIVPTSYRPNTQNMEEGAGEKGIGEVYQVCEVRSSGDVKDLNEVAAESVAGLSPVSK